VYVCRKKLPWQTVDTLFELFFSAKSVEKKKSNIQATNLPQEKKKGSSGGTPVLPRLHTAVASYMTFSNPHHHPTL
jgi:hypothetical protein